MSEVVLLLRPNEEKVKLTILDGNTDHLHLSILNTNVNLDQSYVRNRAEHEGRVRTLIAITQAAYDLLTNEEKEETGIVHLIVSP